MAKLKMAILSLEYLIFNTSMEYLSLSCHLSVSSQQLSVTDNHKNWSVWQKKFITYHLFYLKYFWKENVLIYKIFTIEDIIMFFSSGLEP